jgi:D-beta-D-heptose 7-phosphate kinase/D-beta-D-heptose 1-phosphate adenosyltransferase
MKNLHNKSPSILVIGDLIVDEYLWGSCERISPEAPVQIINVHDESIRLGGAGNVVNNLKKLGANVDIISVIGDCGISKEITNLLAPKKPELFRLNNKWFDMIGKVLEILMLSHKK